MKNFLQAIFSRGSLNATYDPLVMVGGVNDSSGTLTTDVLHFDSQGWLRVDVMSGGGGAAAGTQAVNVVQWGSSNVQSASFGVPTVGWFQRLDQTNDAVTIYASTTTASTFIKVSGTTGSVVVQNTNGSRRLAVANNDSTAVMYLGYGDAVGTQTYFVRIPSFGYWEMPQPIWQGSLAVIWDNTNTGAGRFTILT